MSRDQRARNDVGDGNICMEKFNYIDKFKREEFSVTALQLVVNKCSEKSKYKDRSIKKEKSYMYYYKKV